MSVYAKLIQNVAAFKPCSRNMRALLFLLVKTECIKHIKVESFLYEFKELSLS